MKKLFTCQKCKHTWLQNAQTEGGKPQTCPNPQCRTRLWEKKKRRRKKPVTRRLPHDG